MDTFEWIEAYLADELAPGQRKEFEERLKEDPTFAEEVRLQQDTHKVLEWDQARYFKEQLEAIPMAPDQTSTTFSWQKWSGMAAALLLICLSLYLLWNPTPVQQNLLDTHFEPYPNRIMVRSEGTSIDSLLQGAMQAYDRQAYAVAIPHFSALESANQLEPLPSLYYGISLLANKQAKDAIPILASISETAMVSEPARWYLALALLDQEETAEAHVLLKEISSEAANAYATRAIKLLEEMD